MPPLLILSGRTAAAFASCMLAASTGAVTSGTGFTAIILIVFLDGVFNADDADAVGARAFLLSNGYHGFLSF